MGSPVWMPMRTRTAPPCGPMVRKQPNAQTHLPLEAGARYERKL
jgi:hypothetical protein